MDTKTEFSIDDIAMRRRSMRVATTSKISKPWAYVAPERIVTAIGQALDRDL